MQHAIYLEIDKNMWRAQYMLLPIEIMLYNLDHDLNNTANQIMFIFQTRIKQRVTRLENGPGISTDPDD